MHRVRRAGDGSEMIYDVWVSADGKEIIDRRFLTEGEEFEVGKWYNFMGKKWQLDNFERAHKRLGEKIK